MNTTQKTDKGIMIIVGKALYVSQNPKKTILIHNSNRKVIIMYRCDLIDTVLLSISKLGQQQAASIYAVV